MDGDPSFHSGFRLWAPASLTPAKRLNLVGDGFGEDVDAAHGCLVSFADGEWEGKGVEGTEGGLGDLVIMEMPFGAGSRSYG